MQINSYNNFLQRASVHVSIIRLQFANALCNAIYFFIANVVQIFLQILSLFLWTLLIVSAEIKGYFRTKKVVIG